MNSIPEELAIYQADNGEIKLKEDIESETIWASLDQISSIFGRDKSVISRHIRNIFKDEELIEESVVAIFATTAKDGKTYQVKYFNLDLILSVGYRVNSKIATNFRKWATQTLKEHILQGYTINKERLQKNYDEFLYVVEEIKLLSQNSENVRTEDVLELIKSWFGLDSYDREELPKEGITKVNLEFEVEKLYKDISILKQELIRRGEAAEIFATEKMKRSLEGIFGYSKELGLM